MRYATDCKECGHEMRIKPAEFCLFPEGRVKRKGGGEGEKGDGGAAGESVISVFQNRSHTVEESDRHSLLCVCVCVCVCVYVYVCV